MGSNRIQKKKILRAFFAKKRSPSKEEYTMLQRLTGLPREKIKKKFKNERKRNPLPSL